MDTKILYSGRLLDVLERASLTNDKRLVDEKNLLDQILNDDRSLVLNYLMAYGVKNERINEARKKFLRKGYNKYLHLSILEKKRLKQGIKEQADFNKAFEEEEKAAAEKVKEESKKAEAKASSNDEKSDPNIDSKDAEEEYVEKPIPFSIMFSDGLQMVIYLEPSIMAIIEYAEKQLKALRVSMLELEFFEIYLITMDIDPIAEFFRYLDISISNIEGQFEEQHKTMLEAIIQAWKKYASNVTESVDPEMTDAEKKEMLENSEEAQKEADMLEMSPDSTPLTTDTQSSDANNEKPKATSAQKSNELKPLPDSIKGAITDLTNKIAEEGKVCDILGRDEEINSITTVLRKHKKRNAILLGKPGVGKTAIVERLAYDINTGNVPDELKGCHLLVLSINSLLSGTAYRGMAERRFQMISDYLEENPKAILFIDEIHMMLGAGKTDGNPQDLSNSLKPLLSKGIARVIGATTQEEYDKYFSRDKAMRRRFETVQVKEPKYYQVPEMIKSRIEVLSQDHKVKIEKDIVDYAIFIASCFKSETCNPDRSIDVIDTAMIKANDSKNEFVTKQNVLDVFKKDMKNYSKMDENDKKLIAYHEIGHFIVTLRTSSRRYRNVLAVSIIPAGSYCGVTVYDDNDDSIWIPNKKELTEAIDISLGGRFSEQLFTNELSCGASGDLQHANTIAKTLVAEYGLVKVGENNTNMTFDEDTKSEQVTNDMNKEISKVMEEAEQQTKKIINDNKEIIEILVNKMMEEQILDGKTLIKIVDDYDKTHK